MKQEIQPSSENWTDIEPNSKIVSDDDALLRATGKVAELKRYDCDSFGELWLTVLGCTTFGLVSLVSLE